MSAADSNSDLVHLWTYAATKNYGVTSYTPHRPGRRRDHVHGRCQGRRTETSYPLLSGASTHITESTVHNDDGTTDTVTDGEGVVTEYVDYATPSSKLGRVKQRIVDEGTGKSVFPQEMRRQSRDLRSNR